MITTGPEGYWAGPVVVLWNATGESGNLTGPLFKFFDLIFNAMEKTQTQHIQCSGENSNTF